MYEPFYGSVAGSPIWPGNQFPVFGSLQPPVGFGGRPMGLGPEGFAAPAIPQSATAGLQTMGQGFPPGPMPLANPQSNYLTAQQPYGPAGSIAGGLPQHGALGQPGFAFGAGQYSQFPQAGGQSVFGAFEIPPGVTVPALLAAVAMRRGQPLGPTNDREFEDFLYDALELLPGTNDIEVRCEGGRVTLTGTVQHKRVKHDVGEIAWAISGVNDVVNNVNIAARRRGRATEREGEAPPAATGGRKGT